MSNGTPIDPTKQNTIPSAEPKKSNTGIIILIVVLVVFFLFILPIVAVAIIFGSVFSFLGHFSESGIGSNLSCRAIGSAMTVYYDENDITGVTVRGNRLKYTSEEIKDYLRDYSTVEDGLIAFGNHLVESSDYVISCELNGVDVVTLDPANNPTTEESEAGNLSAGYLTLPAGWREVHSNIGTVYQGNTEDDRVEFDTYRVGNASSLKEASQIYINANTFVFKDDLHISEVMIGTNRDVQALRINYDSAVFPSTAFVYKTDSGFHIITFKVDDENDLPELEETIYTYHSAAGDTKTTPLEDDTAAPTTQDADLETTQQSI